MRKYSYDWVRICMLVGIFHLLNLFYLQAQQYTLTDDDVIVQDGIIISCSYDFELTDIIIPQILDGQTIYGIANGITTGVFNSNGITSVQLPATLVNIGNYAFAYNHINELDLEGFTFLQRIGDEAFRSNDIVSLNLKECINLQLIGDEAFASNEINILNLDSCIALLEIGEFAFSSNYLSSINLNYSNELLRIGKGAFGYNSLSEIFINNCHNLLSIGYEAFKDNDLDNVVISGCTSLVSIGENAFIENEINYLILPLCLNYQDYSWKDGNNNSYSAGDTIYNKESTYYIDYPYTLQDEDVVIENGIIQSCSYSFDFKNIVIPEIIDGQTVIGIIDKSTGNDGVFQKKGITALQLPSSIDYIGEYAFNDNVLYSLNLNNCSSLKRINNFAFSSNNLFNLECEGTTSLESIGWQAFAYNNIDSINLINCHKLTFIGYYAFYSNNLTNLVLPLCTGYELYGWKDRYGNTFTGGDTVTNFYTYYYVNYPYTLQDDDVAVENGTIQSCSYDFYFKNIIIPETLDGQVITSIAGVEWPEFGVFMRNDITEIQFPATMVDIGYRAFFGNYISSLDFSDNDALVRIGDGSFSWCRILNVNLSGCEMLARIGDWSFEYNDLEFISLNDCHALAYVGIHAFYNNYLNSFSLPTPYYPGFEHWQGLWGPSIEPGEPVYDFHPSYEAVGVSKELSFLVLDGVQPIEGAVISLYDWEYTTNDEGVVVIAEVLPGLHHYSVNAEGYDEVNGSVYIVVEDVSIVINLQTVSFNENEKFDLCIYPNPSSGLLQIDLPINIHAGRVSVMNIFGQFIENVEFENKKSIQLNLNDIPDGQYFIQLQSGNYRLTEKWVKL